MTGQHAFANDGHWPAAGRRVDASARLSAAIALTSGFSVCLFTCQARPISDEAPFEVGDKTPGRVGRNYESKRHFLSLANRANGGSVRAADGRERSNSRSLPELRGPNA